MTHLLEIIDDTVEEVNDSDEDLDPFPSITSVLSTKASKDIGAAKYVLFSMCSSIIHLTKTTNERR